MTRTLVLLLLGFALGCERTHPAPVASAKPIEDGVPTATGLPEVRADKPAQSEAAATTLVNDILLAHTSNQPSLLERLRKAKIERSGEWQLPGLGSSKATMSIFIWGDQYRTTYKLESDGNAPNTFAVSNQSGWYANKVTQGQPAPLDRTIEEMVLPDVRADRFTLLFPLANPKLIATMAQTSKDGSDNVVRVWIEDQPPILVHADAKTNRVKRLTYETKDAGQVVVRTLTFRELETVAGVLLPKQLAFGLGNVTMTNWTKIEYEIPGVFDIGLFEKP
jgi:hypothetical protein